MLTEKTLQLTELDVNIDYTVWAFGLDVLPINIRCFTIGHTTYLRTLTRAAFRDLSVKYRYSRATPRIYVIRNIMV